jgi:type I site-specific restriction endonuclease
MDSGRKCEWTKSCPHVKNLNELVEKYEALEKKHKETIELSQKNIFRLNDALNKACDLLDKQLDCPLEVFDKEIPYCDSFNCGKVNPKRCWKVWCLEDE